MMETNLISLGVLVVRVIPCATQDVGFTRRGKHVNKDA